MKIFLLSLTALVCAPAFAQQHTKPADLQLVEKIELAPQSKEDIVGSRKSGDVKAADDADKSRIDGIRLTPSGGAAYFVRDEKREGIARRSDGPELKGQSPTWKVLAW